jgi:effector-binding domain-containing protein
MSSYTEIAVKTVEARTVAYKGVKGSFHLIPGTIGEVVHWIMQKGLPLSGHPVGVYYDDPREVGEDEMHWEIQWPLEGDVAPADPDEQGVGMKRVEPYQAAATVYTGPYEACGPVYEAMAQWITANGYEFAGAPEEAYLNDPNAEPKEEPRMEIRFPVMKK